MSNSQKFSASRYIKAYLDDSTPENPKVKLNFSKKPFSPEQFTHIFMGILESYTAGLLETNSNSQVYEHFNNVFGIFLSKLVPQDEIYEKDPHHKALKDVVDNTLSQPNTDEVKKETDDNRLAAYILARDVLTTDVGMSEESADYLLGKRLGLVQPIMGGETGSVSDMESDNGEKA